MQFTILNSCRGAGKGYVRVKASGVDTGDLYALARASNGNLLICAVYPFDHPGEDPVSVRRAGGIPKGRSDGDETSFVVVLPLLDDTEFRIGLFRKNDQTRTPVFEFTWRPLESKVRSRLGYKLHLEESLQIRDIDQRRLSGAPYVYVTGIFPVSETECSCRFVSRFPYREDKRYTVRVYDEAANELAVTPMIIEDTEIFTRDDLNISVHEQLFAVRVRRDQTTLCIMVTEDDAEYPYGNFACLLPPIFQGFVQGVLDGTKSAYHDEGYASWFEKRRATYGDLVEQRTAIERWTQQPLISIVSVLFHTPADYLRAMIDSVLAQSYGRFELILVNASGDDMTVDNVLREYHDDRIVALQVENRNIATNTNAGIRAARGEYVAFVDHDDVIEPDALYQYVSVIQESQKIDLLYCDEDRLDDGAYNKPFFKPAFNRDLLYSYNYITHMLMVSRYALSRVELSEDNASGAQDYDLILKCIEVSREIRNVPYVLYHWRIHEASTSANPDSKPYADEAGRLALSQHFERIGIPATVHKSELPFRYRTEYLSDTRSKVSIVIPTKDHVSMLANCVSSVLEQTKYDNYEIILVENNSTEPETFSYYEHIQHKSDRVTVVRWPGHGFNYSAICNFGVRSAKGDILLFLNNDTEVISPDWLGSMVNYMNRPDVGVVGAKLLCRDGIVQHGGVWVSVNSCGYLGYDLAADDGGYMEMMRYPSDCAAVTGACQMIRKSLFERIGGLDETLAVTLNDVDLCLKARAEGYVVVFDPQALLYHNEHTSRGRDEKDPRKQRRADEEYARFFLRWNSSLKFGTFINANLNQYDGNFKIRY